MNDHKDRKQTHTQRHHITHPLPKPAQHGILVSHFVSGGSFVPSVSFVPVVSGRYHMHDALLTSLIFFITAAGYFLTAFTKELWQFYLTTSLDYFYTCWGACAR